MDVEKKQLNEEEMDKVAGGKVSQSGGVITGFSSNIRCPKCGSNNLDYEDHGDDADQFMCHCNACGFDFVEKVGN